jgi:hypothetical protein
MFRGYLVDVVCKVLVELSYFYGQLCAKESAVKMMEKIAKEISVFPCKMQKKSSRFLQSNATSPYPSFI